MKLIFSIFYYMNSKCLLFLIFICVFISNRAFSNSFIGIKAGMNFSTVDYHYHQSLTSFNAGIPVEIRFSKRFSLQTEINFITKGGKNVFRQYENGTYYDAEDVIKINYLEVPLYTKFSFGSEKVKLDLLTGPSIGFALNGENSSKEIYYGKIKSDSKTIEFEKDSISKIDFCLNFGAGITFTSGSRNIFFNIIYQTGLTDIFTSAPSFENSYGGYNDSFIFCLGIFTPIRL